MIDKLANKNHIDKSTPLSPDEKRELKRQELVIDDGLRGFIAVGNALSIISEQKLYREDYPSFDDYVKDRWDIGRNYAYRLINGSEVATRVEGVTNECQARELVKVPYTDQEKVMRRAMQHAELEGRPVTGKDIKEAATEPSSLTARKTDIVDAVWDDDNQTELWDMAFEVAEELREVMRKLAAHPEGCWLQAHADTTEVKIRDIRNVLNHCRPAGACPMCVGGLKTKCEVCRSRGWLPKARLDAVNKKLKSEEGS